MLYNDVGNTLRGGLRTGVPRVVHLLTGRLDMFVTEPRGTPVVGESVTLGEVCWIPLLPPNKPGLYVIHFYAALDSGARLEARGLLTVVASEGRS